MIKKIIVAFVLFISINAIAQKSNTSAYSFFGIGDKNASNNVESLSMGGIGVALDDEYKINFGNPAALGSLKFTTYTFGVENKNITVEDGSDKQSGSASYLSYLAVGFPVGENGAISLGVMPNSSVGYSLLSNTYDSNDIITEAYLYSGEGGTNKVYGALGYRLFPNFSIGIQANYFFGKIENTVRNQIANANLATKYQNISNINGFSFNTGFQYKTLISNKINLHLGGQLELENELDADGNKYIYSVLIGSTESPRDTILNSPSKGTIKIPLKSTMGIGFGEDNKWYAGVDYSYQKPIELGGDTFNTFTKVKYDNYSKFAIGGFYTPKINSITSYWDRVTYRAGVKIEKTGLLVDGTGNGTNFEAIDDFGISFGVGLPIGRQLSNVNIGFELGKRGETDFGLVQEKYFNVRLGLSLNDKWFKKIEIF